MWTWQEGSRLTEVGTLELDDRVTPERCALELELLERNGALEARWVWSQSGKPLKTIDVFRT